MRERKGFWAFTVAQGEMGRTSAIALWTIIKDLLREITIFSNQKIANYKTTNRDV